MLHEQFLNDGESWHLASSKLAVDKFVIDENLKSARLEQHSLQVVAKEEYAEAVHPSRFLKFFNPFWGYNSNCITH